MTFASIGEFIVVQRLAFLYNYKSANLMDKKIKNNYYGHYITDRRDNGL